MCNLFNVNAYLLLLMHHLTYGKGVWNQAYLTSSISLDKIFWRERNFRKRLIKEYHLLVSIRACQSVAVWNEKVRLIALREKRFWHKSLGLKALKTELNKDWCCSYGRGTRPRAERNRVSPRRTCVPSVNGYYLKTIRTASSVIAFFSSSPTFQKMWEILNYRFFAFSFFAVVNRKKDEQRPETLFAKICAKSSD